LSHDATDDDRTADDRTDDDHQPPQFGLAAEVWHADDVATALDRWREKQDKAPGRPRGGRE
jgi:hypothetical protein